MSKDCIAAGSTHFACDCVLERLLVAESRVKELEAEKEQLRRVCQIAFDWILLGNHEEAPGWIEARDALMQALSEEK